MDGREEKVGPLARSNFNRRPSGYVPMNRIESGLNLAKECLSRHGRAYAIAHSATRPRTDGAVGGPSSLFGGQRTVSPRGARARVRRLGR